MTSAEVALQIATDIKERQGDSPGRIVVMIAGPPATGQTELCRRIVARLRKDKVVILSDDRELYSREVRARLGISGIDRSARNMERLRMDLEALIQGRPIPGRVYRRAPNEPPYLVSRRTLVSRPVVLLDGFAWCYPDFDGIWNLKYAMLVASFEESERMSVVRDMRERHYSEEQARVKHRICYETYCRNIAKLQNGVRRIYRVSETYCYAPLDGRSEPGANVDAAYIRVPGSQDQKE